MPDTDYLSTDPTAGKPLADALQSQDFLKQRDGGYWEDKGIAGKVWHPNSGASDATRIDNQIGGLPPELAIIGALKTGAAIGGASGGLVSKAAAAVKSMASQAEPRIKYEVARSALTSIGVPQHIAVPIALGVSGFSLNKSSLGKSSAPTSVAEDVSTAPKPYIDVTRYKRIQDLMSKGVSSADAVKAVMALPSPTAK